MTDKETYYQDSPINDKKPSSSVIKGFIVSAPMLLTVMFGLNMIDSPTITQSYMFYLLGLVIFGVMCWLTNSKLKILFVGAPLFLAVIAAAAYLQHRAIPTQWLQRESGLYLFGGCHQRRRQRKSTYRQTLGENGPAGQSGPTPVGTRTE